MMIAWLIAALCAVSVHGVPLAIRASDRAPLRALLAARGLTAALGNTACDNATRSNSAFVCANNGRLLEIDLARLPRALRHSPAVWLWLSGIGPAVKRRRARRWAGRRRRCCLATS